MPRRLFTVFALLAISTIGCSMTRSATLDASRRPMLLQIYFSVAEENAEAFEKMYAETYVPALRKQEGYLYSNLLRLFEPEVASEIGAATTPFNYQMELVFDTEENRRKWARSDEHRVAWAAASGMATEFAWRGFDIVGIDLN